MPDKHSWKIEYLSVDDLQPGAKYQRPINKAKVQAIVDDFDPAAFGVLEARLLPGGKYELLDGQHRTLAWAAMGMNGTKLPVMVHKNLRLGPASGIYSRKNQANPLAPIDFFTSRFMAHEKLEVEIEGIANKFGWYVARIDANEGKPHLRAIPSIRKLHKDGFLYGTLLVTTGAWRQDPFAGRAALLGGIRNVLKLGGTTERLIRVLKNCSAEYILTQGSLRRSQKNRAGDLSGLVWGVTEELLYRYNRGLRKGRIGE